MRKRDPWTIGEKKFDMSKNLPLNFHGSPRVCASCDELLTDVDERLTNACVTTSLRSVRIGKKNP
jgi:hypothetical protein